MASACKDLSKKAMEDIDAVNWVVPPSALVTSDDRPSFGVTTQFTAYRRPVVIAKQWPI